MNQGVYAIRVSKHGVVMTCQHFLEKGHNSKGCKNAPIEKVKPPKKKVRMKPKDKVESSTTTPYDFNGWCFWFNE